MKLLPALLLIATAASAQVPGTWTSTTPMISNTANATATKLPDGRVLVVGGDLGALVNTLNIAQIYDPAANKWLRAANLPGARTGHTAVALKDGRVLVAGGDTVSTFPNINVLASSSIYDPAANSWSSAGKMNSSRVGHTATLLKDGKVLVLGGIFAINQRVRYAPCTSSAEVYDPAAGSWTPVAPMSALRSGHSAALLPDGRVLVMAGECTASATRGMTAEIYDPATNTWSSTGMLNLARSGARSVVLGGGNVLVTDDANMMAELYDPALGIFKLTGATATLHQGARSTMLANGKVLVSSGSTGTAYVYAASEIYDPATGLWSLTGAMNLGRAGHTATLLQNGSVLAAGGTAWYQSAEIFTPSFN